jgi:vacuolar-type H+-ATPase subunit I/STV1
MTDEQTSSEVSQAEETQGEAQSAKAQGANAQAANPFADLLGQIKDGDRQKYSTVEDALKAIPNAQNHIKTLEQENQELKAKMEKVESLEKLYAKLEEKATSQANQPQGGEVFDESKLTQLLESTLSKREQEQMAQKNVNSVIEAFKTKYGDKAEEVYNSVANEAGIDGDTLRSLAARSPKAVLKLAGIDSKQKSGQPAATTSQFRTEGLQAAKDRPQPRVAMVGHNTEDLVSAWRATAPVEN